jgi:hypothetical protein
MAFRSSFFNSENGDRIYNAEHLADRFKLFFTNGVFLNVSRALQVTSGNGLSILIQNGACNIDGYCGINDSAENIALEQADAQYPRMDAITVCLDLEEREIKPVVFTGTPSAIPSPPYIPETDTKKYLCLAYVNVGSQVQQIYDADIKDKRLDIALCGVVVQAVQSVDSTTLFNQIESSLDVFMNNKENEFDTWFTAIKEQLETVDVGQFENRIVALEQENERQTVYIYKTGQASDNRNIASIVNTFLEQNTTDEKMLTLLIQGEYFRNGSAMSDTATFPMAFMRFGVSSVTNRRVIIDFTNCPKLSSNYPIFANSNITIKGLRYTSTGDGFISQGARLEKCIIKGAQYGIKGQLVYAEDCKIEALGVDSGNCCGVNCGGSLVNCDIVAQSNSTTGLGVSNGAFGVRIDDVYPLYMLGGSARAYKRSSAGTSEAVGLYVASGVNNPVVNAIGVRFPQVARSGYAQTNAVKINTGGGSVIGCMGYEEFAIYSDVNIYNGGNVIVNKTYGLS